MRTRVKSLYVVVLALAMIFQLALSAGPALACETETANKEPGEGSLYFKDVPSSHWAYNAIMWMARNEILNGVGGNRFEPDKPVTREQFAKIMVLALQISTKGSYTQSFSDVPKNSWAFKYVEAAKPYLTGWRLGNGQLDMFKPGDVAVREDMAVALVKALGLHDETPDLGELDVFDDLETISENLRRHVAIAVANEIMHGIARPDGSRIFDAQGVLSRAQAAVLVFNALAQAGEKVTYYDDPSKVVYDDPEQQGEYAAADISSAKVSGDYVVLKWNEIDDPRLDGYKVVLSRETETPAYPDEGYLSWITNPETSTYKFKAGQPYNGGDVGGTLQAGVEYYASITALYDEMSVKVPGNVVRVTLPGEPQGGLPLPVVELDIENDGAGVWLTWTEVEDERLAGYKVVLSKNDSTPSYPDNGYLVYITDPDENFVLLEAGESYQGSNDFGGRLESGKRYYARITVLFEGGKKTNSNVVEVTVP